MAFETADYDDLCGCVVVMMTQRDERRYNQLLGGQRIAFERSLFDLKRDRTVDIDCIKCGGTGLIAQATEK